MVMINEEGDRAGSSNGVGVGGGDDQHQHQQQDSYDKDFPPGYRFQPTDQELIRVYLFRKVNAFRLPPNRFADVNIYSCNPWELAAAYETYGESIHYFFTSREKKYPNGRRPNRAAGVGYWKACGAYKPIHDEVITDKEIGFKRSLVFYRGKPSTKDKAGKTNWIMHEYTLRKPDEKEEKVEKKKGTSSGSGSGSYSTSTSTASSRRNRGNKKLCPNLGNPQNKQLDEFVLCKLYLKPDKSTKDTGYPDDDPCDEDITQENNIDFAAPYPSMATATTSAAVPTNYHHMHQYYPSMATATTSAAVPTNYHHMHQYPSTSMVVGAAAGVEEMVPVNRHHPYHMHQTFVAAPVDHQSSLTSPATHEEIMPFINCEYSGNINPSSAVSSSAATLPSMNHHYHEEDVWEMLREWNSEIDYSQSTSLGSAGWINDDIDSQSIFLGAAGWVNNMDSQSNSLGSAGFSVPDIKADIGPK